MKEVPAPLPALQSAGLQEPEVSVDVVWLLVLEEAGLALLCLQRPLEIILTVIVRAALHSRTFSSAKRVCKCVASSLHCQLCPALR